MASGEQAGTHGDTKDATRPVLVTPLVYPCRLGCFSTAQTCKRCSVCPHTGGRAERARERARGALVPSSASANVFFSILGGESSRLSSPRPSHVFLEESWDTLLAFFSLAPDRASSSTPLALKQQQTRHLALPSPSPTLRPTVPSASPPSRLGPLACVVRPYTPCRRRAHQEICRAVDRAHCSLARRRPHCTAPPSRVRRPPGLPPACARVPPPPSIVPRHRRCRRRRRRYGAEGAPGAPRQ